MKTLFLLFVVFSQVTSVAGFLALNPKETSTKCDLLVITVDSFIEPIIPLLEHRIRSERDDVSQPKIITVKTITDSFPNFKYSYERIHAFMRYTLSSWQTPPKYLLLLGTAILRDSKIQHDALVPLYPMPANELSRNTDSSWYSSTLQVRFKSLDSLTDFIHKPLDYLYSCDTNYSDTSSKPFQSFKPRCFVSRVPAASIIDVEHFVSNTINWDTTLMVDRSQVSQFFENDYSYSTPDEVMDYILKNSSHLPSICGSKFTFQRTFLSQLESPYVSFPINYPKELYALIDSHIRKPNGCLSMIGRGIFSMVYTEKLWTFPWDTLGRNRSYNHPFMLLAGGQTKFGTATSAMDYRPPELIKENIREGVYPDQIFQRNNAFGSIGTYNEVSATEYFSIIPSLFTRFASDTVAAISEHLFVVLNRKSNYIPYNYNYSFQGDPSLRYFSSIGQIDSLKEVSKTPFHFKINLSLKTTPIISKQSVHIKLFALPDTFQATAYATPITVHTGYTLISQWDSVFGSIEDIKNHRFEIHDPLSQFANILSICISSKDGDLAKTFILDTIKHISSNDNKQEKQAEIVHVFPNPFNPYLNVSLPANTSTPVSIQLCNIKGECVFQTKIRAKQTILNFSKFPSGLYLLHATCNGKRWSKKVVLAK